MSTASGSGISGPIPPGWYDDPSGSGGTRWWDGGQWTEHLQASPPVAPIQVNPLPVVSTPSSWPTQRSPHDSGVLRAQRVTDGVQDTRAAWWMAFSPLWSIVGQALLFSIVLALLSLQVAALLPEIVALNVLLWGVIVVLAYADRAKLISGGNVSTASPLWALLTPLAYLIARAGHIRLYGTGAWTPVIWWCVAMVLSPGLAVLAVFAAYGTFSF